MTKSKTAKNSNTAKPQSGVEPSDGELLRVNDLLIGLEDSAYDVFAERCQFVNFNQGDVLFEEGAVQDSAFFVIKGTIRLTRDTGDDVNIVYRDIEEGGWFGEIAAIDRGQRTAAAYAVTGGVAAMAPRSVFVNLLLEHRHIAVKVLESLATLVRSSNQRFIEVSSYSGVQRVYLQLLDLAEPDPVGNGGWIIRVMPSHDQLSADASTSRDAVTRAMTQLVQKKVVRRSQGKLRILDRDILKHLATHI